MSLGLLVGMRAGARPRLSIYDGLASNSSTCEVIGAVYAAHRG